MNSKKHIIGNWKMNPLKREEALDLAKAIDSSLDNLDHNQISVGIAPPFLFISEINELISNISLGAQDVFWKETSGAFTGEVSSRQLKDAGAEFVIIGHSERRIHLYESDEIISKKIKSALNSEMKVLLCIGEPKEVKEKGIEASFDYVKSQLKKDLDFVDKNKGIEKGELIVAYEPLWSISTFEGSEPAKPEEVNKIISFIKSFLSDKFSLNTSVLYGGSTDSENIISFLEQDSVDGVLVGSSSLDSKEFLNMIRKLENFKNE